MKKAKSSTIGFVFGMAVLALLAGRAAGYVDGPQAGVYVPPSLYIENGVAAQDDYIYYPDYQVYYSGYRRQFVYLVGRSWVSRPAPPHVSPKVMFASPSVKVDSMTLRQITTPRSSNYFRNTITSPITKTNIYNL